MAHVSSILDDFDLSKLGARFERGKDWALLLGNSDRILRDLAEFSPNFDALITDPPYSSGGQFRGDRNKSTGAKYRQTASKRELVLEDFEGDNRDQRSFLAWCSLWLSSAKDCSREGAIGFCFSDWRQVPITTDALQAGGWIWRGLFSWDKIGGERPAGHGRFSARCEFGVWGSKGALPYIPNPEDAIAAGFDGKQLPGTYGASAPRNRFHVTQKPVALLEYLSRVVPKGGTILDPFAGSASMGMGALRAGRRFFGIELDERAFEKSAKRLEAGARDPKLLVDPSDA